MKNNMNYPPKPDSFNIEYDTASDILYYYRDLYDEYNKLLKEYNTLAEQQKFLYHVRQDTTSIPAVVRKASDEETIKELQQENFKLKKENKQLQECINKLDLENKVLKEQMVAMVQPNYIYGIRGDSNE